MDDTISRQAAIEAVTTWLHKAVNPLNRSKYNEGEVAAYKTTLSELKKIPSAERHGRWILDENPHDGDCRCSVCGVAIDAMNERNHGMLNILTGGKWWTFDHYCPWCGAKMDEGEEDGRLL